MESYDYVLNGSPITFAIIEVDGVFVDLAVFDSNVMDFGLYTDVTTARDVLYSVIGYLGLTPPPKPIAPVPTPTPTPTPVPAPAPTPPKPVVAPPIAPPTPGYEFRFVPGPTPAVPWATKGYWEYGPKGQLLAPITVMMAYQRVKYGFYPEIREDIALWYKQNYPELWPEK